MCRDGSRSDFRIKLLGDVSTSFVVMVWALCGPARQSGRRWQRQRCKDVLHSVQPRHIRWPSSNSHRSRFARSRLRPRPVTLCFRPSSRSSALSNRGEHRGPGPRLQRDQGTAWRPERKERRSATAHRPRGTDRRGAVPHRSAMLQVWCRQPTARAPHEHLASSDNWGTGRWRVQNCVMMQTANLYQHFTRQEA